MEYNLGRAIIKWCTVNTEEREKKNYTKLRIYVMHSILYFSKIQLVVYYQCCVLIGRAAIISNSLIVTVAKSARHICNVLRQKKVQV